MTTGTTLADRLTQIRETFESGSTPSHIVNVLNAHVDWLVENSVEDRALKAGAHAPLDLPVVFEDGPTTLQQLSEAGNDFLVLTWFRGNW